MSNALVQSTAGFLARPGSGQFAHVSQQEVDRLTARAKTEQTRLLIKLLWHTGARVSEIIDTRLADLDFNKGTLMIRRRKRRKAFAQTIPLPGDLMNAMRLFARARDRRGRVFNADRISVFRAVQRLGKQILGRKISPHQFRHGRAYHLVGKGVHPLLVSRALGHASLSSALSYYHPTEEDLRKALED
jgi:integrase